MGHVVQWIVADTGLPKASLLFLLQHGTLLDLKKKVAHYMPMPVKFKIVDPFHFWKKTVGQALSFLNFFMQDEEDWILYVFDKSREEIPRISPHLPSLVEKMFRDPTCSISYEASVPHMHIHF